MKDTGLENWIPFQLVRGDDEPLCRWLFLNDKRFTEPFFQDTISACKQFAQNTSRLKCVSSLDYLPLAANAVDSVTPSAIIFHVSRCGSTLASQLLSLQSSNIVLSEVPLFDELLRWQHNNDIADEVALPILRAAIALYGQKRGGIENKLIIKADSWHVSFYEKVRQLFPLTPFILLYRDPVEVARSQRKRRGMQAVPGLIEPSIFGFDTAKVMNTPLDEYMPLVLERYYEKFVDILENDRHVIPINYKDGAICMIEKIADAVGLTFSDEEIGQIRERAGFHAKYPGQAFFEEQPEETIPNYLQRAVELYKTFDEKARAHSASNHSRANILA